jgi:hypothetical protein
MLEALNQMLLLISKYKSKPEAGMSSQCRRSVYGINVLLGNAIKDLVQFAMQGEKLALARRIALPLGGFTL